MLQRSMIFTAGLVLIGSAAPDLASAAVDATALEALQNRVNSQQKQIDSLATALEKASTSSHNNGLSSGKTKVSGYAEIHYNNLENQVNDADSKAIDIHRFVLEFSHQFSDELSFFSELEVEHGVAGEGQAGEVELEQAFIQWQYLPAHHFLAGVMLVPAGILNETHEPNTFYGVERNNVEKNIIPSTWWEAGIGASGELGDSISYQALVSSGLKLEPGDYKIRDGRQKASEADASELAYTFSINYRGLPGLTVGGTLQHQADLLQGASISGASDVSANLIAAHLDYQRGSVGIRAVYALWDIDSDIELLAAGAAGADEQQGHYIEPSYKITEKFGIFTRFSQWDNNAGSSVDSDYQQVDVGANYWLHENVALKIDFQDQHAPTGEKELDGFNLGLGLSF